MFELKFHRMYTSSVKREIFQGQVWSKQNKNSVFYLRIDNSGDSVIFTFDHNSETVLVIIACDIPNKRILIEMSL